MKIDLTDIQVDFEEIQDEEKVEPIRDEGYQKEVEGIFDKLEKNKTEDEICNLDQKLEKLNEMKRELQASLEQIAVPDKVE